MAWLAAVPDPPKGFKGEPDKRSRYTRFLESDGEDSPRLIMPDIGDAYYLIAYLNEIGPCSFTGFGPSALSWTEIYNWCHLVGLKLSSWEATLVRELSGVYASEYSQASDPLRAAPVAPAMLSREQVSNKLKNILGNFRKKKTND